jgi:hypothetical protein
LSSALDKGTAPHSQSWSLGIGRWHCAFASESCETMGEQKTAFKNPYLLRG